MRTPKPRPHKEKGTAQKDHFTVWVSADQKSQINELIKKWAFSKPILFDISTGHAFKRPEKRRLPKATADTI
ncbi:hypothetical protein [Dyadobacter jiangsuensis]|nr:hypothetical protein [Dyadobacter jiangsuensis]